MLPQYLVIDQKSYYATVECVARGLDPMKTNLVVADPDRSQNTICLAVSPSMKVLGVKNRCRIRDIPGNIKYIVAPPRMQLYIDCAAEIHGVFLKHFAPQDIFTYSIRLLLATGMRTQELLALEPRHIAIDGSSISITQAVVMEEGSSVIGPTKTHDSVRTVPVPEMVRECARKLRATDKKFVWEAGRKDMPCNPTHFRKQFRIALGNIEGVRILTPHCCRHTYVTHMLMLGVDPKTVQALVGHADVDMTMYYAHAQETSKQAAIARYNEAFSNRGGGLYGNVLPFSKTS